MRFYFKLYRHGLLFVLCFCRAHAELQKADIASPMVREGLLLSMDKNIAPKKYSFSIDTEVLNPFAPPVFRQKTKEVPLVRQLSDHELIVILAAQLNPTGVLMLGDQSLLTFREKKVKVGEIIKIPFDNHTYEVEVVDVSRTAFTIKFNNEEITRPIKSGKQ